jgi:hypothetical protein
MAFSTFCRRLIGRPEVTPVIVNDFLRREVLKDPVPIRNKLRFVCRLPLLGVRPNAWARNMDRFLSFMLFCLASLMSAGFGAAKPHVISFGKWTTSVKSCRQGGQEDVGLAAKK